MTRLSDVGDAVERDIPRLDASASHHRMIACYTASILNLRRDLRLAMGLQLSNVWPKLVIIEGIMGSGKSTTTRAVAQRLEASGIRAIGITEGVSPHPIRFDWCEPWDEMPPAELAKSCIAKWRSYVESAQVAGQISVVDGQLFHDNLTSLFLLEADASFIFDYCRQTIAVIKPLKPLLVYFHQNDIDSAIRTVSTYRGESWVDYQLNWKLTSPYALRRGLKGLPGLITLYRDYRALTDQLFADLDIPKLGIENSRQAWARYHDIIDRALMNTNMGDLSV
jgi:hypothetical protein